MHEAEKYLSGLKLCDGPYSAADGVDALVILTEWDQFRALDFERMIKIMKQPLIVDLRNIYIPSDMKAKGFEYFSIGRA